MKVELTDISKRYTTSWVLRNISVSFDPGTVSGLSGANGSGKSTLLRIISGFLSPSKGNIKYHHSGKEIPRDEIYSLVSFAAPYISPPRDLTLLEVIRFAGGFRSFRSGLREEDIVEILNLQRSAQERVLNLSSGQAQRLNLALAILTESPLLLLDEPTSYLDEPSKTWFHGLLKEHCQNRCVILASNDPSDFQSVDTILKLDDLNC